MNMAPPETWFLVPDNHMYEASSYGRIRRKPGKGSPRGKLLKLHHDGRGYLNVTIDKTVKVHHVIASVFLGKKPFPEAVINHKDGNGENNHYKNLEWCTQAYNVQVSRLQLGESHHRAKLTEEEVLAIRTSTLSNKELAKQFNVTSTRIGQIRNGKGWHHVSVK